MWMRPCAITTGLRERAGPRNQWLPESLRRPDISDAINHAPPDAWKLCTRDYGHRPGRMGDRLREIGARYGRTPGQVAIAWTLRRAAITATIVGARRPAQVDEFIGAGTFSLSAQDIEELDVALARQLP